MQVSFTVLVKLFFLILRLDFREQLELGRLGFLQITGTVVHNNIIDVVIIIMQSRSLMWMKLCE